MVSIKDTKKKIGQRGEEIAVRYLKRKGYKVLARNFRSPLGEVDIIAQDEDTLVFVEVRTCSRGRIHEPEETIGLQKQRKIIRTSQVYIQKHFPDDQWAARFDVVAVEEGDKGLEVRHIPDAFESQEE